MTDPRTAQGAAAVDYLVDEKGSRIDVPDDSRIRPADEAEPAVGGTGPTNWWRLGIVALGIVIAILLVLQFAGGNPGTDVQPGTPTAERLAPTTP